MSNYTLTSGKESQLHMKFGRNQSEEEKATEMEGEIASRLAETVELIRCEGQCDSQTSFKLLLKQSA